MGLWRHTFLLLPSQKMVDFHTKNTQKIMHAAVNCDMYFLTLHPKKKMLGLSVERIKEENRETAGTISKLTGVVAYSTEGGGGGGLCFFFLRSRY